MASDYPVSTLAAALARPSGNDILKPRDAGHPGNTHSVPSNRRGGLPTPPNSLSPTIPPQKGSPSAVAQTPLNNIESDVELQDVSDPHGRLGSAALSSLDAAGDITPALLAKYHLPGILLQNGPLAIRYVLGDLTSKVPGFARIPAAKARRIVVAALENRAGGGLKGDVVFEKVGWGRWDARYRDQPPREVRHPSTDSHTALSPTSQPIDIHARSSRRSHVRRRVSPLSPGEHSHVSEHEADKMSLDGDDDRDRRRRIPIIQAPEDSDMTDEEDWESIGPDGLNAQSYAASFASRRNSHSSSLGRPLHISARASSIPIGSVAKAPHHVVKRKFSGANIITSMPGLNAATARSMSYSGGILPFQRVYSSSLNSSIRMQGVQVQAGYGSPQEAEAVEALLRMGSM
jgi:putative Sin3 binding protein